MMFQSCGFSASMPTDLIRIQKDQRLITSPKLMNDKMRLFKTPYLIELRKSEGFQ